MQRDSASRKNNLGLSVIIPAAGQGTRMRSEIPKVMHELAGEPLLGHVLRNVRQMEPDAIHVVVGSCNRALDRRPRKGPLRVSRKGATALRRCAGR